MLQGDVVVRCAQMVVFITVAALVGKRVRLVPPLIMFTVVTAVNLTVPNGRILFSVGSFNITRGALVSGLSRSALLVGMIYLSRLAIGPGLRLPGRFGSLLLRAFAYFESLTNRWPHTSGTLTGRLDELMQQVQSAPSEIGAPTGTAVYGRAKSVALGVLLLAVSWIPYAVI
jgi:heptaprenyl diphosphate synthase